MKISRISFCISGLVKVAILTCAHSVSSLTEIIVIITKTWSSSGEVGSGPLCPLPLLHHHQQLSMPPSCSAVSCVSLTASLRQLTGQSQSEQRVVWTQSLTGDWSGQSASVTADVHQMNPIANMILQPDSEDASHSAVLHYHYRLTTLTCLDSIL